MKRSIPILIIVLAALGARAIAQPTPVPGLQRVNHDSSMTGSGTIPGPLGVRVVSGGGITTNGGTTGVGLGVCPSGQVWQSVGATWGCADGSALSIAGTLNHLPIYTPDGHHLGDSPATYDGTTFNVGTKFGVVPGTGAVTARTMVVEAFDHGVNIVAGDYIYNPTDETMATAGLAAVQTGTFDTRGGNIQNAGFTTYSDARRSHGSGLSGQLLLNVGIEADAYNGDLNYAYKSGAGLMSQHDLAYFLTGVNISGAPLDMGSQFIHSVTDPVSAQDAVTLHYLQGANGVGIASGVVPKGTGTGLAATLITESAGVVAINSSSNWYVTESTGDTTIKGVLSARQASAIQTVSGSAGAITGVSNIIGGTANGYATVGNNIGTYDTTAGQLNAYGLSGTCTATKSAGSNLLDCISVFSSATGGDVPYDFYGQAGNFLQNGATFLQSTVSIGGDVSVATSKFTIAAATGNMVSAGTGQFGGAVAMTAHKVTGLANGSASDDAAAFGQISSAVNTAVTGTNNTTAKFTTGGHALANGWALDDGSHWGVSGQFTIAEGSGDVLAYDTMTVLSTMTMGGNAIVDGALIFDNATNSAITSDINPTGYGGGTAQFRNLRVKDGKNTQLALFDGVNARMVIGAGADAPTVAGAAAIFENAGTTSIAVRDATNDHEIYLKAFTTGGAEIGTSTNDVFAIRTNNTIGFGLDTAQNATHYAHVNASGSTPTINSCGTPGAIVGTDFAGIITVGTSTTTCSITFAHAFTNTPICVANSNVTASGAVSTTAISNAGVTFSPSATALSGDQINYICVGQGS